MSLSDTVWISCGVLRKELEALRARRLIAGKFCFLDSMLHMDPPRLEGLLTSLLKQSTGRSACLVLVYGDCCSRMLDLVRQYRVGRVPVINCAQLLLGRERYRELMHEEAFLVLPEWAERWEQVMHKELGLTEGIAHDLMQENRRGLVYLDTGLTPVPEETMHAFASYSGLPWRVESVSLETMLPLLLQAQQEASLRQQAGDMV